MSNSDRFSVPLYMIEGNMGILLENVVKCEGVSFRRYTPPDSDMEGVVLVFHNADKEQAEKLGFQYRSFENDSRVRR
jgi:hypothetical protein